MTYSANSAAIPPTIPPTARKREGMAGGVYPAAIHFPIGGGGIDGPKGRRDESTTEAGYPAVIPPTRKTMIHSAAPPPEAAPLADARRHLAAAASALRAAVALEPKLSQQAGVVHAVVLDQVAEVERLQRIGVAR